MIVLAAIVVALLLHGPSHATRPAPSTLPAPSALPEAPVAPVSSPAASTPAHRPEISTLMTRGLLGDVVEMVPGKPPSSRYPAGTMFLGAVVGEEGKRPKAKRYEWDVARAAVAEELTLDLDDSNGKIDPGTPHTIRLGKDGDHLLVLLEVKGGAYTIDAGGWVHPTGGHASIAGERGLVAVAYYVGTSQALEIELFHPSDNGPHVLGHTRVDGDKVAPGQRPAALTFLRGRLYVATRPNPFETVVAELHIPSLRVLATYRHRRASTRHARSQLIARDEWVYLLDRGELVELPQYAIGGVNFTPRTRNVDADEVAVHWQRVLTTGGVDQPSMRGDFVPALGAPASCTPAWSENGRTEAGARIDPTPMLACAVAGGGVQIVKLPLPAAPADGGE